MELLLNLVWVLIACSALLGWIAWRHQSDSSFVPQLGRGLLVVGCILVLLFPVISITDDLAQSLVLAEGNKLQDVLKGPESRHYCQFMVAATLMHLISPTGRITLWREAQTTEASVQRLSCWGPNIEKRPPPQTL